MNTKDAMLTRRSIRKFKPEPVSDESIQSWIRCGMYAPSAGNEQPWHFIVIKDPSTLKVIPRFHQHAKMLSDASCGILVCLDAALEKHDGMAIQDCAATTQNILLAVHDDGFSAVWLGVYPRQERMKGLTELLSIPEGVIPFSLVAIGKADEVKDQPDRYMESRIHHEKW